MDDILKIKVLMIYYDHWGKEEITARKIVCGLNKTIGLLKIRFQTEENTIENGLKKMFYYLCNEEVHFLWTEFVEIFLQDLGGCFEPLLEDDFYEEEEMLFDRKILLEDNLNLSNEDTADLIYANDFSYENVLSVDAIVALL
jgi:hypothetical protein